MDVDRPTSLTAWSSARRRRDDEPGVATDPTSTPDEESAADNDPFLRELRRALRAYVPEEGDQLGIEAYLRLRSRVLAETRSRAATPGDLDDRSGPHAPVNSAGARPRTHRRLRLLHPPGPSSGPTSWGGEPREN
jgi:hypothetical protein